MNIATLDCGQFCYRRLQPHCGNVKGNMINPSRTLSGFSEYRAGFIKFHSINSLLSITTEDLLRNNSLKIYNLGYLSWKGQLIMLVKVGFVKRSSTVLPVTIYQWRI